MSGGVDLGKRRLRVWCPFRQLSAISVKLNFSFEQAVDSCRQFCDCRTSPKNWIKEERKMMRKMHNPRIAIAVLFSLLTLNLSFLNLPQAQVSAQTGKRPNLGQAVTEPVTFEDKDQDGKTLARLHVSPTESSSRFQFLIEDFQTAGKADGTVEVADGALKVRFTDALSRERLGMDFRPDQWTPGRQTITLLHNKRRCEITIDGARAKEIAGRMQELSDQGRQEEVKQLVPLIRQTFSGGEKYFAFTKRVASSPALGMLATTAALEASLSSGPIHQSPTR